METVSVNNQSVPISDDETEKFTVYSSAVHKVVVMVNTGILGLLQIVNQQSSHKGTFLCFCVFVLFYAILRVREAIDMKLRPGLVSRLFGHMSHLFGGLATIVLISVINVVFALVLLFLWFLWLSAVVYHTLTKMKESKSSTGLPQLSLV